MTDSWTSAAISRLTDYRRCPRCSSTTLVAGVCSTCNADLRGEVAVELAASTLEVVAALEARTAIIDRLPVVARESQPQAAPATAAAAAAAVPAYRSAPAAPSVAVARPSSQLSLQSVLAVAGAGLFAIAAIFFTFFSAELEGQQNLRSVVVAVTTIVFLVGAWLLVRSGLRFSGETVGALGMVFVALDVWAVSRYAQPPLEQWTVAAIGTLIAGAVLVGVALLARIRTWLWTGIVALAFVPAFFGYGAADGWFAIVGHVSSGFAALAAAALVPLLAGRFSSSLAAERVALVVVRVLWLPVIAIQLVVLNPPAPLDEYVTAAGVLLSLAVLAALSTRDSLPRLWSLGAGGLAALAGAIVPLGAMHRFDESWFIAIVPLGALAALLILTAVMQLGDPMRGSLHRVIVLIGAWIVTVAVAVPSGFVSLYYNVTDARWMLDDQSSGAALAGVTVPFIAGLVLAIIGPRLARAETARATLVSVASASAGWFGMYALLTVTSLTALTVEARLAIGILSALAVGLLLWRVPAIAAAPLRVRVPIVVGAHVILLHALVQSWPLERVGTIAQGGIIIALVVLSFTVARIARPLHIAAAFTLALFIFSGSLDEYTVLESDAIIALTATLAVLTAIGATLLATLRNEYWYAILVVTAVPFVMAIAWRLITDTGWIALPAAAGALLGVVLLVSQRPGQLLALRALGGAMVLPTLAVVAVGVVPELTTGSGSPIVLPIIAGLVALALPATVAIGRVLERQGISVEDARIARLAVEASALVTAAIAVVIALLRAAAGFDTTFLVLAIVGLGGAATAVFSARRYGWVIAYSAWSGALWCLFALWGVEVLEPYVLPPAIAAVIIGAVAVFRGRPGQWMVIVGLVAGAIPTLGLLAAQRGDDTAVAWRLWGLLGATVLLIGLGVLFSRVERMATLRVPVLAIAILTASAGMIGAVNEGLDREQTTMDAADWGILPVLGLAVLGAALAAVAARLIALDGSRWLFVPALAYLVVGTSWGIRHDWVSIVTLLLLMVALLIGMIAVAAHTRTSPTTLPPVWLWFALAWTAGVVSWSQRELRVEAYSLVMGTALLIVGILAWRSTDRPASVNAWPVGFSGSWRLLGPGLFVVFVPSILSTATDPRTERAILVIVLALAATLLGSRLKLAAPFLGGIAVLPLENIMVFAVQSSRGIESTPWWITLASAGAVLLVIAVTAERKSSGGGIAARIRDLN